MVDAFISYSREDKAFADGRGMERVLRDAGLTYWRDDQMASGSVWSTELSQQLHSARAVVVLWSANSWNSFWVRQEAFFALMKDNLIPLMIKERPAALELPFASVQTYQNDAAGFAAAIAAIRTKA